MSITRRLFLRHTAAAGASVTVGSAAVAEPIQPLTPDERIETAIEMIKAAYLEKWPNAPLRIVDTDDIDNGMIIVLSHAANDAPGSVQHVRNGAARKAVAA